MVSCLYSTAVHFPACFYRRHPATTCFSVLFFTEFPLVKKKPNQKNPTKTPITESVTECKMFSIYSPLPLSSLPNNLLTRTLSHLIHPVSKHYYLKYFRLSGWFGQAQVRKLTEAAPPAIPMEQWYLSDEGDEQGELEGKRARGDSPFCPPGWVSFVRSTLRNGKSS